MILVRLSFRLLSYIQIGTIEGARGGTFHGFKLTLTVLRESR